MYRISQLFEEDLKEQDNLENLENMYDDGEDIILTAMEERYQDLNTNPHLFTDEISYVNENGFTREEETALNIARLNDELQDDIVDEDD